MSPESRARSRCALSTTAGPCLRPCKGCGGRSISRSNEVAVVGAASARSPSPRCEDVLTGPIYVREGRLAPASRRAMGGEARIVARFPQAARPEISRTQAEPEPGTEPTRPAAALGAGGVDHRGTPGKRAIADAGNPEASGGGFFVPLRKRCGRAALTDGRNAGRGVVQTPAEGRYPGRGFWGGCWTKTNRSPIPLPPVTGRVLDRPGRPDTRRPC